MERKLEGEKWGVGVEGWGEIERMGSVGEKG